MGTSGRLLPSILCIKGIFVLFSKDFSMNLLGFFLFHPVKQSSEPSVPLRETSGRKNI